MYAIAIDGPAGSGKSSIAKNLAKKLNINYIDTGAMYRAITLKLLQEKEEMERIVEILEDTQIDFKNGKIFLDGIDVSSEIRSNQVSKLASKYSQIPQVRKKLVELQQEIASHSSVVMEGRDIGTVVLPHAKYKFYLTASPSIRAQRRYLQLLEKGEKAELPVIESEILLRDENDMNRRHSPLKRAEDAILLDNSNLDEEQTLQLLMSYIKEE